MLVKTFTRLDSKDRRAVVRASNWLTPKSRLLNNSILDMKRVHAPTDSKPKLRLTRKIERVANDNEKKKEVPYVNKYFDIGVKFTYAKRKCIAKKGDE